MAAAQENLAAVLHQTADLLQVLGQDPFRVNAYQRVARMLEDTAPDLAAIGADEAQLQKLPGVGKGMAQRLAEFLRTGKIQEHQELLAQVPPGVLALLDVPGLGPKTVALFWKQAGVTSREQLKTMLAQSPATLLELPGVGEKKLDNLRKSLDFTAAATKRFLLGQVYTLASWLVGRLRQMPQVKQAQYAGSLRRGRETVGDLDILVAAREEDGSAIGQAFVGGQLARVGQVLGQGPTKTSIRTDQGLQIDLRIVPEASFGAALLYFTGSKEHNVQMRQRAIDRGLKLNEYGLYRGEEYVAGATEEEVLGALDLAWIPPELREAHGEIALAEKNALPNLLQASDIVAELHAHTTASDGKWSIRELVLSALDRGFHTVAVTDHSVSQTVAHGLSAERLEKHIEDVRTLAKEFAGRIRVLAGSEVDILADGRLDYPNSLLKELDLVVASPHAALAQEPAKATARLLKAITHPYVTILAHPTGRLLNRRPGLAPDMRALIAAARERGIALEINANSHRLDLRDTHARLALEQGVKLAIDTDAHGPADLDQLIYGVLTARRAGATKADVVNTFDSAALAQWLASTRR